ncbi:unnamed protein product [Dicrocoelium dendriticum]|nr:unnamed protein product [Dicrocoelium dendriticum]
METAVPKRYRRNLPTDLRATGSFRLTALADATNDASWRLPSPRMGAATLPFVLRSTANHEDRTQSTRHRTYHLSTVQAEHTSNTSAAHGRMVDLPQFRCIRKRTTSIEMRHSTKNSRFCAKSAVRQPVKAVHSETARDSGSQIANPTCGQTSLVPLTEAHLITNEISTGHARLGIVTNPYVRRRYSAGSYNGLRFAEAKLSSTPTDESLAADSSFQTAPQVREHNPGESYTTPCMTQPMESYVASQGSILVNLKSTNYLQPSPQSDKCYLANRRNERHSVGTTQNAHNSDMATGFHPIAKRRSSGFLNGIQKSTRHTLNTLKKALGISASGNPASAKAEKSVSSSVDLPCEDGQTGPKPKHFDSPIADVSQNTTHAKTVVMTRHSPSQPFGLFVTKHETGFYVSRLSEQFLSVPNPPINCGDQLLKVGGVSCSELTITELQPLFSQHTSVVLTLKPPEDKF